LAREQRRLAAIVAADAVGYSRLMERDESGTVTRLRQNRVERLDPILARSSPHPVSKTPRKMPSISQEQRNFMTIVQSLSLATASVCFFATSVAAQDFTGKWYGKLEGISGGDARRVLVVSNEGGKPTCTFGLVDLGAKQSAR
jgi:class 3 adenylate cyclase